MSKKYEVWVRSGENDVKVYESDAECDARIIVDGVEVYRLTGNPVYAELPPGVTAQILEGGEVEATYTDDKGKSHKVMDKSWKT